MSTFSENFVRILTEKGVTVNKLSEKTGLSPRLLYKYRSRKNMQNADPSAYNIKLIANALGVTMDELYGDIE